MPELTLTAPGPLVVGIHLTGSTTVQASRATDLGGGIIELELGDLELGARLIGRADVIAGLLDDALRLIRGQR